MFNVKVNVKIDLKPLEKYIKILTTSGQTGFDQIMIKWVVRYKKYALAQFNQNSKGGGIWPPLKLPIRKHVKKRSRQILRDSDTLRRTLDPVPTLDKNPRPGIVTNRQSKGVVIGFGGGGSHPYAKLSVARLAIVHHLGLGRVPVRSILISPTEEIKRRMVQDVKDVANKTKRDQGLL